MIRTIKQFSSLAALLAIIFLVGCSDPTTPNAEPSFALAEAPRDTIEITSDNIGLIRDLRNAPMRQSVTASPELSFSSGPCADVGSRPFFANADFNPFYWGFVRIDNTKNGSSTPEMYVDQNAACFNLYENDRASIGTNWNFTNTMMSSGRTDRDGWYIYDRQIGMMYFSGQVEATGMATPKKMRVDLAFYLWADQYKQFPLYERTFNVLLDQSGRFTIPVRVPRGIYGRTAHVNLRTSVLVPCRLGGGRPMSYMMATPKQYRQVLVPNDKGPIAAEYLDQVPAVRVLCV